MTIPTSPRFRRIANIAAVLLAGTALAACANTRGPTLVLNSSLDYNRAVRQVNNEQILLNIVRRRYMDPLGLVSVSSITTNFETTADLDASTTFVDQSGRNWDSATFGAGVTFTDNPTISVSPLAGADTARALHAAMDVDVLGWLANAGYRFDLLLSLLVQDVNGVRGIAGGLGDEFQGGSPEFLELTRAVGTLLDRNELVVGTFRWEDWYNGEPLPSAQITAEAWQAAVSTGNRYRSFDAGHSYYFTDHAFYGALAIAPEAKLEGPGRRIIELLRLDPNPERRIWIFNPARVVWGSDRASSPDARTYDLRPRVRSFDNLLSLLAYGVDVPDEDVTKGRVFSTDRYRQFVAQGLSPDVAANFRVRSSLTPPREETFVTIAHRGRWFYIEQTDFKTKHVFKAVNDLYELQVAPSSGSASDPVLTLPVAN